MQYTHYALGEVLKEVLTKLVKPLPPMQIRISYRVCFSFVWGHVGRVDEHEKESSVKHRSLNTN